MNIAGYARVSSEGQLDGYSIPQQKEIIENYCKIKGWNLVKIYVDGGFTGANTKRPALQDLIEHLDCYDLVLVYKLDRLSRSQRDTLALVDQFAEHDVKFASIQENFDTSTPLGMAMLGILSVFAQLERENIKERMSLGRRGRIQKGLWRAGSNVPTGYDYIDGHLVIREDEAEQIRKIFELYLQGWTINQIRHYMHANYTNRYSSWAQQSAVSTTLRNALYIGMLPSKTEGKIYRVCKLSCVLISTFLCLSMYYIFNFFVFGVIIRLSKLRRFDMDNLYNIEPKEFKVLERHEVGNCITYVLEPTEKPSNCPDCQDTNIVQHGINQRKVRDLNEYNKLVGLVIKGHRYRCKTCGKTWADTYKSIDDSARMTNRMRDYITDQCLKTTFTDIKKELDISLTAIEKVFAKYTEEMESQRQIVAPRILGMDETMLNGIYRGMYVDVENKRIIDITSNRKLRTVKQWLANLPEKERTECATIDMWGSYKDALTSEMPNVFIVIDKFHVIKHLNEALDTIRKKYTSELSEKERRHIKGNRWLLLTNSEDLDESSQIRLSILLQSFPAFQEPHAIKEKFREIYLFSKNRSEAEQAFEEWKTTINDYPEYLAFADTVENWRTEIFNYFDFRFTNAITESLNKVSKEISAQGRGYKFDVLRAKLLYRNEAAKPAKFAYHEPQRPSTGVMQDMTFGFMTPFFGKKKSVEVGAGTDIDILSEKVNDIVEIRQRIGRLNRYANKFKYWEEQEHESK